MSFVNQMCEQLSALTSLPTVTVGGLGVAAACATVWGLSRSRDCLVIAGTALAYAVAPLLLIGIHR